MSELTQEEQKKRLGLIPKKEQEELICKKVKKEKTAEK